MSDSIQQLVDQTDRWARAINDKADYRLLNGVGEKQWREKFAQLVAQQCINILINNDFDQTIPFSAIEKINEQFINNRLPWDSHSMHDQEYWSKRAQEMMVVAFNDDDPTTTGCF